MCTFEEQLLPPDRKLPTERSQGIRAAVHLHLLFSLSVARALTHLHTIRIHVVSFLFILVSIPPPHSIPGIIKEKELFRAGIPIKSDQI